jgi:hypothetical protein
MEMNPTPAFPPRTSVTPPCWTYESSSKAFTLDVHSPSNMEKSFSLSG